MKETILITGATGFVGSALLQHLQASGRFELIAAVRNQPGADNENFKHVATAIIGDINADTDWSVALSGVNVVVHTAARAHVIHEAESGSPNEFVTVNLDGTLRLARQASLSGVRRFIFLSSIGVHGDETVLTPFSEISEPNPSTSYALSKWKAEQGLRNLANESDMDVVIIRPPLIYGRGAPGSFDSLLRVVAKGVPLPLKSVQNRRSFVALANLLDFIVICINHPAAANEAFLISDGEDLSTSELLNRIGVALGKPVRLFPFPLGLLKFIASFFGKKDIARKLFGSLQVDSSKARILLGWEPPVSVDGGLLGITEELRSD